MSAVTNANPILRFLEWLGNKALNLIYETKQESILSLTKAPNAFEICLNDVIAHSVGGMIGKDPEPLFVEWVKPEDFEYISLGNSNLHHVADIKFNRQIKYEPKNTNLNSLSFVSGTRELSVGKSEIIRFRKKRSQKLFLAFVQLLKLLSLKH